MPITSKPKKFPLKAKRSKHAENSGIFSDSGAGQKKDPKKWDGTKSLHTEAVKSLNRKAPRHATA